MPLTKAEILADLQAKLNAAFVNPDITDKRHILRELAETQSVMNPGGSGGGSVGGTPLGNNPAPVFSTTTSFSDDIELYNWVDEPMADAVVDIYPTLTDPRWVSVAVDHPVRVFYMGMNDLVSKNILGGYLTTRIRAFMDVGGKIYQLYSSNPINSIQSAASILSFTTPVVWQAARFLVVWEKLQHNNTGTTSSLVGIDRNRIVAGWGYANYAANFNVPTKIRFDYSRQNVAQPAVYGAMGAIKDFNSDALVNTIALDWAGYTPPNGSKVRILATPEATFVAPPGIGYVIDAASINRVNHTLIVRGGIPPIIGKPLRLRLISGIVGGQGSGSVVSFSSAEDLGSGYWKVTLAYQNSRLSLEGAAANRWIYLSYIESPVLEIADNILSYNGNPIQLFDECLEPPIITPGAPTVFTWAGHGKSVGDKLILSLASAAGVYPTNIDVSRRELYVKEILTANTFTVSEQPGLPAAALGTVGSGLTLGSQGQIATPVTASTSTPATVAVVNHGLAVRARCILWTRFAANYPSGLAANTSLFAKTVTANTLTLSGTIEGIPVAFGSAGTGLTLRGTNTLINPACPIELSEYWLTGTSECGEYELRDSPNGAIFPLCSTNQGAIMLESIEQPLISGKCSLYCAY